MSQLHQIVSWAKENGDEKVLARMKVFTLGVLLKEKISLEAVTSDTKCTAECLEAIRTSAAKVVGKPCPF